MQIPGSLLTRRSLVQAASALVGAGALGRTPLFAAPVKAAQEAPLVADPALQAAVEQLDTLIAALMQRDGTPGMTLAVTDRDGVLFTRQYGFADLRAAEPIVPETRFEFGSIGKTFTATLIMQLVEEGKLDLNAPVTDYLPWFDDRPIRVEDGLTEATWFESSTADGSLIASASTLTTFLRMLLNDGAGPDGPVISAESVAQMVAPATKMDVGLGFDYGYAIMSGQIGDQPLIGHTGGMLGYLSAMFGLPELGIGAVAMVNGPGDPVSAVMYALEAIPAALAGEELPALPIWPDVFEIPNAAEFVGAYSGDAGEIRLEASDIGLDLINGDTRTPLQGYGPDTFMTSDPAFALFLLRAGRNDAGEVVELTHGPNWYRGEAYDGPTEFDVPAGWEALPGHYRSHNPWQTNFRIGLRKGQLWLFWRDGREELLTLTPSGFQPQAPVNTPLRLTFDGIAFGQALRASWNSGDDHYYRFFTP